MYGLRLKRFYALLRMTYNLTFCLGNCKGDPIEREKEESLSLPETKSKRSKFYKIFNKVETLSFSLI